MKKRICDICDNASALNNIKAKKKYTYGRKWKRIDICLDCYRKIEGKAQEVITPMYKLVDAVRRMGESLAMAFNGPAGDDLEQDKDSKS